jgi:predicted nucleic acid-binding protein
MTELILKNKVSRKKLHSIIRFLKALDIEAEVKDTHERKKETVNDPFTEVWGICVDKYCLSHRLRLPDAIIAAIAIYHNIELFTLNLKDFTFLPDIKLYYFNL